MATRDFEPPEHVGVDAFERRELILVLLQTLSSLGLQSAKEKLEQESGIILEIEPVKKLHRAMLSGEWDDVPRLFDQLGSEATPVARGFRLLAGEQKYTEELSRGDHSAALKTLREDLAPAAWDAASEARVHRLALLFLSPKEKLVWPALRDRRVKRSLGDEETILWRGPDGLQAARVAVWEQVQSLLPPSLVVPPHRLADLLTQALRYQEMHCLYHTDGQLQTRGHTTAHHAHAQGPALDARTPLSQFSLLHDHSCTQTSLPTKCVCRLEKHFDEVWFVSVSNSGKHIASSSKDKTLIVWDAEPPCGVAAVLIGHSEACSYLAWSPDDSYLASGSNDRTVRLWSPPSAQCVRVFAKHVESVTSVCWMDDEHFLSAGFDKVIYLWHVTGTEVHRWVFPSRIQDTGVTGGRWLLVVNADRNIKVIDLQTRKDVFALPESDPVTSICASRLSNQVLVNISAQAPVIRLWDLQERRVRQRYFGHLQGRFVVRSAFGGPQEQFVVSGSEDSQVYIWHRHFGSLLEVVGGHASTVNCVCWPHLGAGCRFLLSASDDHTLRVWAAPSDAAVQAMARDMEAREAQAREAETRTHEQAESHEAEEPPPVAEETRPAVDEQE